MKKRKNLNSFIKNSRGIIIIIITIAITITSKMKTNNIKEIQTKVLVRVIDLINSIINSMINSTINSMINSIIKITPMDIITTMDIRILAQKASSLANSMEITIIIIIISLIIMSIKRKMDLVKSLKSGIRMIRMKVVKRNNLKIDLMVVVIMSIVVKMFIRVK